MSKCYLVDKYMFTERLKWLPWVKRRSMLLKLSFADVYREEIMGGNQVSIGL